MFISRERLHVCHGVAFVNNLSAQQRLNGVLKGDNPGGLAKFVFNQEQVRLLANEAI